MNKNDQEFIIQKIRSQYVERENTQLDVLKALDQKVKTPANVFGWIFGGLSAIIMGSGMSLVMTELGEKIGIANGMVPGIIIGCIGLVMAVFNYPIYKGILGKRRAKYADQIIRLSDNMMEE